MAMVSMKDLLQHAYNNHYAVGAFEIVSLDFLNAVIQAAEKTRSPVIFNVVEAHFDLFDVGLLMAAVVQAAKRSSVPVAVHMDHCSSLDTVGAAINLGCNGVMYDGSNEDLPVNIKNTRQVVELAHACGVPVEGELGHVAGIAGDNGEYNDDLSVHTSVQEAKVYVERSGVDFLAISIGTVHGRVNGKTRLDFTRLARIRESVDIPFVIHGGTGLNDQQYHRLIDHGVAKINCFTALAESAVQQIQTNLSQEGATYREVFARLSETIAVKVQHCMQMWGSAGRAAEVLMQCDAWQNIEHVIVYNTSVNEPAVVEEMLRKGKEQLSNIPGVLDVQIGKAIREQGTYRYCWLIRFAHASVIESYKTHPIHVAYADTIFRPLAADRISNDYVIVDDFELGRQMRPMTSQSA